MKREIQSYNKEILNWDFKSEPLSEFLRLLTEKNVLSQELTPIVDFHPNLEIPSRNESFIDNRKIKIPENIAFHVGFPHQRRLYPMIDPGTGTAGNLGVFFSLRPEDVVYYSDFEKDPLLMVYFLEVGDSKGIRVQTKYDSATISRYEIDDFLNECLGPNQELNECQDHDSLRLKLELFNEEWIANNTIPFNTRKIKEFRNKGYDWLVTPAPIEVR